MSKRPVTPEHAERCRRLAGALIEPLRAVARAHGYALGVHGSLARDIDLIGAPWSVPLSPPWVLAEAIRAKAEELTGFCENLDAKGSSNPIFFHSGCAGLKRHGRHCFSLHLGPVMPCPYIDLSVLTPGREQGTIITEPRHLRWRAEAGRRPL